MAHNALSYRVIECSHWDEQHLPSELEKEWFEDITYKGQQKENGWQSMQDGTYPIELVIDLQRECEIKEIQLVIHEYRIPRKVQIWTAGEVPHFTLLG